MKKYQRIFEKDKKEEVMENYKEFGNSVEAIDSPKQLETVVLAGIHFKGDIKGSHDLYLNGELEGTIELSALCSVGRSGRLKGEIKAENIIIEGNFEGSLSAKEKVEVRDGGRCVGDILAPSVMISDKAFFQGQVTMMRDDKKVDGKTVKEFTSNKRDKEETEIDSIKIIDDIQPFTKTVSEKSRDKDLVESKK